jgi:hypothetical protein
VLNQLGIEQFNQIADDSIELPAAATGTWTYAVRKYGSKEITGAIAIDGSTYAITPAYMPDTLIKNTLANVIAYTVLNTSQEIYDYLAYYGTTAAGIAFGVIAEKGFGTLTVPAGLTLLPGASALVAIASGVVTAKTTIMTEAVTLISNGIINSGTATLSENVQIRASNLDSELSYTADMITFYPTAADRDADTNEGATITGGLYRFKIGAIVSGVILSGTVYLRVITGGVTSFADKLLTSERNVLDLGLAGKIDALAGKLVVINDGVKKASIIIPHTNNLP